jgi:N-acetylglucosamine-6-phosphate deacetylase
MQVCGKAFDTGELLTLTLEGGQIASMTAGSVYGALGGPDVILAPGFIDLQLNGYGGYDFNGGSWHTGSETAHEIAPIISLAARAGTPLICPTIYTDSHDAIAGSLSALASALEEDASLAAAVPGIHLEGPYLSSEDGARGAHPLPHVCDPSWEEFLQFQEAAAGRIKILTLAPERPGALPFIEKVAGSGVVVAIGHTAASPQTIRDAVRAGATMSTHLGNGAQSMLPRHPNHIWEQLASDDLTASVIFDGHHLPPAVARVFARVKGPERLALVSDAVSIGGLPPGIYSGGRYEILSTGKIVLAGTPYLAGAGHLMDTCVANALRFTDLSLPEAIRSATAVPARILGLGHKKGKLAVGYDADLVLFRVPAEGPLDIVATLRAGEVAYAA